MPPTALPTDRLAPGAARLVYSDADLDRLGVLSRKTRWRLRREGRFPRARQSGGRKFYIATEVLAWIEDPQGWGAEHGG